ncbi:hypothetical protein [Aquirhabdus sp.]|uniref:hypothetical protein n=1 Tax=Aquirhabdus sp. TaxID=2824160 RepID=UPI00396C7349
MSLIVSMAVAAAGYYVFYKWYESRNKEQDIRDIKTFVRIESMSPPNGSTIHVAEKISITLRYECSAPRSQTFALWVQGCDEDVPCNYASTDRAMSIPFGFKSGKGKVTRWISPTTPGTLKNLIVVVETDDNQPLYECEIPVNYTVIPNPKLAHLQGDGRASRITGIAFAPSYTREVPVNGTITVTLDYDIASQKGLHAYVTPETDLVVPGRYEPSSGLLKGRGTIKREFSLGGPCRVEAVRVALYNVAEELVVEEYFEVDYRVMG